MLSLKGRGCEQIQESKYLSGGKCVINFLVYWWWSQKMGSKTKEVGEDAKPTFYNFYVLLALPFQF